MPDALERELQAEARRKFPKDKKRQNAYVYGTMRKLGWVPGKRKRSNTRRGKRRS